jgi:Na+/proline symporter
VEINTIVLIVYLLLTFGIAGWGYKVTSTSTDYWVAGRSLGVIVSVGTFFATLISSWSVLGAPGYFYSIGWAGCALASITAGTLVTTLWFVFKLQAATGFHPVIPGTLAAILFMVVVSLLTKAPPQHVIDEFFTKEKPVDADESASKVV